MKAKLFSQTSTTTLESQLTLFGIIVGLIAMLVSGKAVAGDHPGVPVYPANAKPFGKSLTEWSIEYWKWFNSIPAPSPLLHLDADTCVNQSGPVWFLADAGFAPGAPEDYTLTRRCTVPVGVAIFVPVLTLVAEFCPEWGFTDEQIKTLLEEARPLVQNINTEVDGVEVPNLDDYNVLTPAFDIALPADSEIDVCPVRRNMLIGQAILVPPLSVGEHTIRFGWFLDFEGCEGCGPIDITYHLTVVPR